MGTSQGESNRPDVELWALLGLFVLMTGINGLSRALVNTEASEEDEAVLIRFVDVPWPVCEDHVTIKASASLAAFNASIAPISRDVFLSKSFVKELRVLSADIRERVFMALRHFSAASNHKDVRKVKGHKDMHRMRVGEYRLIYRQNDDGSVLFSHVLHRREAYRLL